MSIAEIYEIFKSHPQVTTDSRNCPIGSIFFALKGESFDGNKFAVSALDKGCAYAVVDDASVVDDSGKFIPVDDVLTTLQELAHYHRSQLKNKTILQITGTNGKTTTKELVSCVLSKAGPVQFTQGNLNNHIGVPLTLLTLVDDGGFGVIETGANHPGEIAFLSRLVDADMGLITNVGRAHLEGFGSFEGVKKTKGELYDYLREHHKEGIFLNADDADLVGMAKGMNSFTYGCESNHDLKIKGEIVECNPFVQFRYKTPDSDWQVVQTNLIGAYNINNLLAAIAVGVKFGAPLDAITEALESYVPSNNRSEFRDTGRNRLIIDAYNANPSSMAAAIDNFSKINTNKKMVILGDMKELGEESLQEHKKVVDAVLNKLPGCEMWFVGNEFSQLAPCNSKCFVNVDAIKPELSEISGYTILIKGSNGTRLFQLPPLL